MKKTILLLIVITAIACKRNGQDRFFAADNRNIALIGRFDLTDKKNPVFMYSGCSIRTVFSGKSVEILLKDDSLRNMFNVMIDDSLFILTASNPEGEYLLADNLKDGRHTLEVYRRTEWNGGNTVFSGFRLGKGGRLFKPEVKDFVIEFIGNSYTCGYGNEGGSREEHFKFETENNYLTYGSLTARALDAEYIGICRSGIGMCQGYGGDTTFIMPDLYDEVTINNNAKWEFRKFIPKLVVIDLGGNDFSAPLDSAVFVDTYMNFLARIRKNYKTARVVCVAGPSNPDDLWEKWKSYIHTVVEQSAKTDDRISYFEFTPFEPNGSDWHPNVVEHTRMSEELIPCLENLMK